MREVGEWLFEGVNYWLSDMSVCAKNKISKVLFWKGELRRRGKRWGERQDVRDIICSVRVWFTIDMWFDIDLKAGVDGCVLNNIWL